MNTAKWKVVLLVLAIIVVLAACHHKPAWKAYPPDWMEMCWDACEGPFVSEQSSPGNCVCGEEPDVQEGQP